MRLSLSLLLILSLTSCYSKLDKKENEPLMLDLKVNENLTIAPEAFIANAINYEFLEKECEKFTQNANEFLYVKDSSTILIRDKKVQEVHLKSSGNFLNYGLEIGQDKTAFETTFIRLSDRNTRPFIRTNSNKIKMSCCSGTQSVWDFEFENGVLKRVDFVK